MTAAPEDITGEGDHPDHPEHPDQSGLKDQLLDYLQMGRDALLWKLDGASEYDIRRPLTPTGTNLLGLVKHVATVEAGYLGDVFGRPSPIDFPWIGPDAAPNADFLVEPDHRRQDLIELYRSVWEHSNATVAALSLEDTGEVPWWSPERRVVTLGQILVHITTETHRHAGHADIVRELVDGTAGLRADHDNLWVTDEGWATHTERVEQAARQASR